jgi:hypothetical protein
MRINVLGLGIGLRPFSRHCSALLLWGSAWVLLVTASGLAGTQPPQPTADVAAAMNTRNAKCPTAVVTDHPGAATQRITGPSSVADVVTTTGTEVAHSPELPKTEVLQDKVWSTSLSRSSKNSDIQKAPQCGITTEGQSPAN